MPSRDYSGLIGLKFGRLTVTSLGSKTQGNRIRSTAICQCDCGCQKELVIRDLTRKDGRGTQSCGCLNKELSRERISKVRLPGGGRKGKGKGTRQADGEHHPLFVKWVAMIRRCEDPKHKSYHRYGGRGVIICDRWRDFENFRDDCIILGWEPNLTMDRINNNGNYEPSNVRFVDNRTQARNRETNRIVVIDGESKCVEEWCQIFNRNRHTVDSRIDRGMNEAEAIFTPTPSPYKPWGEKAS